METVDLSSGQKERIMKDMEDYLKSSDRYTIRGIPYRRGYLFHGPPGTGKTSFTLALAGHLKADICILSLSGSGLDDEDLLLLVSKLPRSCILLVEDIDVAGLTRDDTSDNDDRKKTTKITLSGFLNAIDGITSPQGHILIMTTNCPSKLDPAILRPGRVDVMELIDKATKETAKSMFIRMCSSGIVTEEVRNLATQFVTYVEDKSFSPAELQGFFQQRRDPKKACAEISEWVKVEKLKGEGNSRVKKSAVRFEGGRSSANGREQRAEERSAALIYTLDPLAIPQHTVEFLISDSFLWITNCSHVSHLLNSSLLVNQKHYAQCT